MGWLEWLIGAALSVAAAWLIAETVSYFVTKQSLRQLILQNKNSSQFQSATSAMIKNNTGHEVTFDMLDGYGNNLGSGKVTSNAGISSDIRYGDAIIL